MTCASRPPSIPSGMVSPLYARTAMSSIGAPCSGSPFTYQRPFSQARSSGRVSSIVAAISRAVSHLHVLWRDPELLGHDLGEGRLVALALGLRADAHHGLAGRVHAQVRAVVHRQAEDDHVLARPGAHALGEERDADPHQLPARPLLGLLAPQLVVA